MKREQNLLSSSSCTLSLYHLVSTFIGILLTFLALIFLEVDIISFCFLINSSNDSWVYQLMIQFIVVSSFFFSFLMILKEPSGNIMDKKYHSFPDSYLYRINTVLLRIICIHHQWIPSDLLLISSGLITAFLL